MENPQREQPRQEQPSTYFVQDRANQEELTRLQTQDRMMTAGLGGVLPEQDDPTLFHRVLDVGCGTGGWLIEAARQYPTMTQLIGVDVSQRMIEYAREQAREQGVAERVEFSTMDALRMLEFPNAYFDLANIRVGSSFLRTWDWDKLLQELRRVTRPQGIIRVLEMDLADGGSNPSPATQRFQQAFVQISYQSGHIFTPEHDSLLNELPRILERAGIQHVQSRTTLLEFVSGTPELAWYLEDFQHLSHTMLPFLQKWGNKQIDYKALFQDLLDDIQGPDFKATWKMLTFWGNAGSFTGQYEQR